MSLYETGDSNGSVSLLDLKNGVFRTAMSENTINDYACYVCRGGWPLFKSKTWAELKMSATEDNVFQEAVKTIYRISEDERHRSIALGREDAIRRKKDIMIRFERLQNELAAMRDELSTMRDDLAEKSAS